MLRPSKKPSLKPLPSIRKPVLPLRRRSPPEIFHDVARALDPTLLMQAAGLRIESWHRKVLFSSASRLALLCPRQSGKSTTVAVLALHTAIYRPRSTVLVVSPTQSQSDLLFRKITDVLRAMPRKPAAAVLRGSIEFANGSRILSLPGCERTIRGHTAHLIIIDEAARVPDDLYQQALLPMTGATDGRIVALSTPHGRRGFFFHACTDDARWECITISPYESKLLSPKILEEARSLDEHTFRQEYLCEFISEDTQFFPSELIEAAFDPSVEPFNEPVSRGPRFVQGIGPTWG